VCARNIADKGRTSLRIAAWPAGSDRLANPYSWLFSNALRAQGCRVDELDRKRLLTDRYDIVHVHWPEWVLASGSIGQVTRLLAAFRIARVRGAKLFWTVHNLESHERPRSRLRALWARDFLRQVDGVFSLTRSGVPAIHERFKGLDNTPTFVIPHGHYRGAYPDTVTKAEARAALGIKPDARVLSAVGQLRQYKGIETLLGAFRSLPDPDAVLLVAGKPVTAEYGRALTTLAQQDPRVHLRLGLIPTDEMQWWMRATDLAVLPYVASFNSGAAWLALSFDRPVLAPALGSFIELREEFGSRWVNTYDGALDSEVLQRALQLASEARHATVDLSKSNWDAIGAAAVSAYQSVRKFEGRSR